MVGARSGAGLDFSCLTQVQPTHWAEGQGRASPGLPPTQFLHAQRSPPQWRACVRACMHICVCVCVCAHPPPRGATLPVTDGASRGVAFKHRHPLVGAPGLDCSHPGTGAAESCLPFSFPLKRDLPLALPLPGITWGGKVFAAGSSAILRTTLQLCGMGALGQHGVSGQMLHKPPPSPCAGVSQTR